MYFWSETRSYDSGGFALKTEKYFGALKQSLLGESDSIPGGSLYDSLFKNEYLGG